MEQKEDMLVQVGEKIGQAVANMLPTWTHVSREMYPEAPVDKAPAPIETFHRDWLVEEVRDNNKFKEETIRDLLKSREQEQPSKFHEDTIRNLITAVTVQPRAAAVQPGPYAVQPVPAVAQPVSAVQPQHQANNPERCKESLCDCECTQMELRTDYQGIKAGDCADCCGHKLAKHPRK